MKPKIIKNTIWRKVKGVYQLCPTGNYQITNDVRSLSIDFQWMDLKHELSSTKSVSWEELSKDPKTALAPYENIIELVWHNSRTPFMFELRNKMLGRGLSPIANLFSMLKETK